MPGSDLIKLRGALEEVMREAGELARFTSRGEFKRWTKGDESPVSEGDIAVNNLLHAKLRALVPQAGWLSEETEDDVAGRSVQQAWVVDPIDGTRAYIAGFPDWTISVGFVENGRPVLAALFAPVTDEMFLAVAGHGTTLNGTSVMADRGDALAGATLAGPKRYLDRLGDLAAGTVPQPKIHSLALRLTRVAHGGLDLAIASPGSHDWDLAAADLLVHEAGGALTDLTGRPLLYNQPHTTHPALIAAGHARHGSVIGLMRDRLREFA